MLKKGFGLKFLFIFLVFNDIFLKLSEMSGPNVFVCVYISMSWTVCVKLVWVWHTTEWIEISV